MVCTFRGAGSPLITACASTYRLVVKEPPKMVLRRMMGPSLETGTVLDAVLSVNYCANCDWVSVRAVQEKCDEKRQVVRLGKPMRETAVESHSFPKVREKDGTPG
jgi:hypothetical protein